MDDERIWAFEKTLWTDDADHYRHLIDTDCVMVIPTPALVAQGAEAVEAVARTPRWEDVTFSEGHIVRPQDGLIVIAYRVAAKGGGQSYEARCTST